MVLADQQDFSVTRYLLTWDDLRKISASGRITSVAVDPSDPQGKRAMIPQFEIRTRLVNPDSRYVPGQRAVVRLTLKEKAPWLAQWSVRFWQMIQQRAAESKF